jgi:hypothetical protein
MTKLTTAQVFLFFDLFWFLIFYKNGNNYKRWDRTSLKVLFVFDLSTWDVGGRWLEAVLISDVGDGVGLTIITDEAERSLDGD